MNGSLVIDMRRVSTRGVSSLVCLSREKAEIWFAYISYEMENYDVMYMCGLIPLWTAKWPLREADCPT